MPFYLPITVEDIDPEEVLRLTKSDKKAQGVCFVLSCWSGSERP